MGWRATHSTLGSQNYSNQGNQTPALHSNTWGGSCSARWIWSTQSKSYRPKGILSYRRHTQYTQRIDARDIFEARRNQETNNKVLQPSCKRKSFQKWRSSFEEDKCCHTTEPLRETHPQLGWTLHNQRVSWPENLQALDKWRQRNPENIEREGPQKILSII